MTHQLNIVGLGGTLNKRSKSLYALDHALTAARLQGAKVTRYSLRDLNLPMFDPHSKLADQPQKIQEFIETVRSAHGMIWSTGAYHGSLAGVMKNAIDYFDYLRGGDEPFLNNKVIGLIATAGGDMAGVNTLTAMTHSVHSLRGMTAPLMVSIPHASDVFDSHGNVIVEKWENKLDTLGKLVFELTAKQRGMYPATVS